MISNATVKLSQQRTHILTLMTDSIRAFMLSETSLKAPESMDLFRDLFSEQQATLVHLSGLIDRQADDRTELERITAALVKHKMRAKAANKRCETLRTALNQSKAELCGAVKAELDQAKAEVKRLFTLCGQHIDTNHDLELEICDWMEKAESIHEQAILGQATINDLRSQLRAKARISDENRRLSELLTERECQIIALQGQLERMNDGSEDVNELRFAVNEYKHNLVCADDALNHAMASAHVHKQALETEKQANNMLRNEVNQSHAINRTLAAKVADQAAIIKEFQAIFKNPISDEEMAILRRLDEEFKANPTGVEVSAGVTA